jgi:hypothetical protein
LLFIVLLVVFVVVTLLWLLALLGTVPAQYQAASQWLAFFAVLVLGIVVFLGVSGAVVMRPPP